MPARIQGRKRRLLSESAILITGGADYRLYSGAADVYFFYIQICITDYIVCPFPAFDGSDLFFTAYFPGGRQRRCDYGLLCPDAKRDGVFHVCEKIRCGAGYSVVCESGYAALQKDPQSPQIVFTVRHTHAPESIRNEAYSAGEKFKSSPDTALVHMQSVAYQLSDDIFPF